MPTAASAPLDPSVTVFPLTVVFATGTGVASTGGGVSRGRTTTGRDSRRGVRISAAAWRVARGAGAASLTIGSVVTGTPFSSGWADVSVFASARSRVSVVSLARMSAGVSPTLHAPRTRAIEKRAGVEILKRFLRIIDDL